MQDGTALTGKTCARCYHPLNGSIVYRDHALWHAHCWQEGEHLLANATRIARAVTPPLVVPERLPPDSPLRIVHPTTSRAHGCRFLT